MAVVCCTVANLWQGSSCNILGMVCLQSSLCAGPQPGMAHALRNSTTSANCSGPCANHAVQRGRSASNSAFRDIFATLCPGQVFNVRVLAAVLCCCLLCWAAACWHATLRTAMPWLITRQPCSRQFALLGEPAAANALDAGTNACLDSHLALPPPIPRLHAESVGCAAAHVSPPVSAGRQACGQGAHALQASRAQEPLRH